MPFFLGGVFGNLHQRDSGGYKYIYIDIDINYIHTSLVAPIILWESFQV